MLGQPEGAGAPNLGQSMGILTLHEMPALPAFDMLLPWGFSFTSNLLDHRMADLQFLLMIGCVLSRWRWWGSQRGRWPPIWASPWAS